MKTTVQELLIEVENKWGNRNYIWQKEAEEYVPKTFSQTVNDVLALAEALLSLNLKGKKIIIYSENSYHWAISDLAIMGYVGVSVVVNKEWKIHDLSNITNFIDIAAIIYSNSKKDVVNELKEKHPETIYLSMQDDFPTILREGNRILAQKANKHDFEKINPDLMSKIIFSSGTTATPKAAMLSQTNMFSGWDGLVKRVPLTENDKCYIFLPLSTTFAGIFNFLFSLLGGWSIYLNADAKTFISDLSIVKPTVVCVVPLVLEKIYNNANKLSVRTLLAFSNFLLSFGIDIRLSLFKKLHDVLGMQDGYLICGGSFFDPKIKKFYKDTGFIILEGYALTETASVLSITYPNDDITSVGTIYEDIDVKVINPDDDGYGELVVKGDNVFLGYYNNEQATEVAFDEDGYFYTGDIGFINNKRKVFLKGRKRRVIITNNGLNVFPDEIEELFLKYAIINKVKVYEDSNHLAATLYVTNTNVETQLIIDEINQLLPRYMRISKHEVILDTIDNRIK